MSPNLVILAAAALGMIVNTLGVLAIVWRGGRLLGRMEGVFERVIDQLDKIEARVSRLEAEARG